VFAVLADSTCQADAGCDPTTPLGWIIFGVGLLLVFLLLRIIWTSWSGPSWFKFLTDRRKRSRSD
jgi:hypothetical protein